MSNTIDPSNSISALFGNNDSTTKKTDTGENAFLKLLVEQLKHQDPLEPQDGTQFVAQLAQFNSLEQLISINTRLGEVLGKDNTNEATKP